LQSIDTMKIVCFLAAFLVSQLIAAEELDSGAEEGGNIPSVNSICQQCGCDGHDKKIKVLEKEVQELEHRVKRLEELVGRLQKLEKEIESKLNRLY
jgi:uncharacterized protein (DUF342 family)